MRFAIVCMMLLCAACQHQEQKESFPSGLWQFSSISVPEQSNRWMTPVKITFRQCINYSTDLPLPKPTNHCQVVSFYKKGDTYFWTKHCGSGDNRRIFKSESTFTEDTMTGFLTTEIHGRIAKNKYVGKRLQKSCQRQ